MVQLFILLCVFKFNFHTYFGWYIIKVNYCVPSEREEPLVFPSNSLIPQCGSMAPLYVLFKNIKVNIKKIAYFTRDWRQTQPTNIGYICNS